MSTRSHWKQCVAALLFAWAGTNIPVAAQSDWAPGANMNVARARHTATVLPDGRVLVVGGYTNPPAPPFGARGLNRLASVELYDPVKGTWRVSSPLRSPRSGHTATLLPDGRVLVVGGTATPMASEIYDAATETWMTTDSVSVDGGQSATVLRDGRVLVIGGAWGPGNVLFDPTTQTVSPAGSLNVPRYFHTATRVQDGRVLVAGGWTTDIFDQPVLLMEWYDPTTQTFTGAGDAPVSVASDTATLLADGRILFAEVVSRLFDPATSTWAAATGPYEGAYGPTVTSLQSGNVLLAGGRPNSGPSQSVTQQFDPRTTTWSRTSSLLTARSEHTATKLQDGKVLVAGGTANPGTTVLDSTELLAVAASSPGSIGPGFSGSWFDPAQNGHGIFTQVLPENRFLAAWLAFDAGGAQAWFVGVGSYAGNTATLTAVAQPSGGRWIPNFDPARIMHNAWGSLTFTFADCNRGRVDFSSSVAGFGSGSMELTRLTVPAGLTCP